jgi:molybdopterin-containing oxidoreductase family membrane subunit
MQAEDNVSFEPVSGRSPLILGGHDFHSITEIVAAPIERSPSLGWWLAFAASASALGLLLFCIAWLFWEGIGIWGLNVPVGWAFDITNFVFWIGIGHAGTLISAILFLFRQSGGRRSTAPRKR